MDIKDNGNKVIISKSIDASVLISLKKNKTSYANT